MPRFDYSLTKMVEKHPEGVPNRVIAQALLLTEADVQETYDRIVEKLRKAILV